MIIETTLPQHVIEQDQALEKSVGRLMELRWHWTLDENNPGRISVSEYARQVGRSQRVIYPYAHGFKIFEDYRNSGNPITPSEAIFRGQMSAETAAAVEAVAEQHGTSFTQTKNFHYAEVRGVREMAREVAERKGTLTVDEIPQIAQMSAAGARAGAGRGEGLSDLQFLTFEVEIDHARRHIAAALRSLEGRTIDAEERLFLQESVARLTELVGLVERWVARPGDQGWKHELRLLEGGVA